MIKTFETVFKEFFFSIENAEILRFVFFYDNVAYNILFVFFVI